jgi:photosystem II stability/assembly factor-like uncharacterized protein
MRGHIVFSDDNGNTWVQAEAPISVTLTSISFPTPEQGWAVGHSGVVLHSSNGGQSWELQTDGRRTPGDMITYYQELAAGGDETAAWLVQDLPINWTEGPEQPWLGVWFENQQHGFITGSFNLILETSDGGRSWTPWTHRVGNPGGMHLNAVEKIGSALYLPSEGGIVFRMAQGEEQFSPLQTAYSGSFFGICGDQRVLLAYGLRGTVYASFDQGDNWMALPPAIPVALTGCTRSADSKFLLAAASGHIIAIEVNGTELKTTLQNGAPWPLAGITTAADGHTVGVGMRGVWRAQQ